MHCHMALAELGCPLADIAVLDLTSVVAKSAVMAERLSSTSLEALPELAILDPVDL